MNTDELREKYLSFFETKGHARRQSDVLVPTWDPSVLFTPAGMNQFKPHFLGKVKLEFTRATTCQKCLRTGDIENVGRTAFHHTFFEMLGNFSFGDYFKREAINWAWEFLTDQQWLALDPARLSVTVYKDDDEAAEIWKTDIKLPESKIERLDEDENFWPASAPSEGPDGVCGPCSEIFYHTDSGESVEIWNLVFTQFNRVGDPPDNLRPLPSKNIDTGMGLERTAATLQGVSTNYHIDTLLPIVEAAGECCSVKYDADSEQGRRLRRITDHVRACAFAVHENVYPGPNKERYVIKRLLRRAVLDGHQMGLHEPFLYQLVPAVVEAMKAPYPELSETTDRVAEVIRKEESNFFATIDDGLARIDQIFSEMKSANRAVVNGEEAAKLYQTFGVPAELFASIAAERNLTFDWDGYQQAMAQHSDDSGAGRGELFATGPIEALKRAVHVTESLAYETMETEAEIKGIIAGDQLCDQMEEVGRESAIRIVLDRSPFYGESGGQVGDSGRLVGDGFEFEVVDTKKDDDLLIHYGHLTEGRMTTGAKVTAKVDTVRREAIRRAHSATHILHHALQKNLGRHAQQQGSKVDGDWLRFDFTNPSAVASDQLEVIQQDVVGRVSEDASIAAQVLPLAEAREAGAMMLFGEKYPDPVRMISMGEFSKELCGGTHLDNTGAVGAFEIIAEESVSAGTRRIVALTGERAEEHVQQIAAALDATATVLGIDQAQVPAAAVALAREVRDLKKQLGGGKAAEEVKLTDVESQSGSPKQLLHAAAVVLKIAPTEVPQRVQAVANEVGELRQRIAEMDSTEQVSAESLWEAAQPIGPGKLIVTEVTGLDPNRMRQLIDQLRKSDDPVAVLLAGRAGVDKVVLVAGVSRDLEAAGMHAGNWVRDVAKVVGGSGGGKPSMAQAGGKLPDKLPEALATAMEIAEAMLGSSSS